MCRVLDYAPDYVLRLILHRPAETSVRLYTRLCAKTNFTKADLILLETNVNDALTLFSIFKFIFHCSADLMASLGAKTSSGLYTRLCSEANFT